jgi:integrase
MEGCIEKRGEQVYRLKLHLGYDASGKRLWKSVTVHGSRRDAQKRLAELLTELHASQDAGGTTTVDAAQPLGEYLDFWLTTFARRKSSRTYENYREYVDNYIKPGIGTIRLDRLQTEHIQAFYDRLEVTKRRTGDSLLSPTTVFNCHRVLKGALRRAVLWKKLRANPADGAIPPKPVEREPRLLTPEQIAVLLKAAGEYRLYVPILLGLSTGMRRGELCGLRWSDVRLDRGTLSVRQTLVRIGPGRLEFKSPKTKSGRRNVKLPTILVEALTAEKEGQEEARRVLGPTYNAAGLVLCRADGTPQDPATLYSNFQKLLIRLGLPRMAIHDLRHSHATLLLEEGAHIKVVAERLGHSDPGLTMRVYSHVLDHMQQSAADQTDAVLRGALSAQPDAETNGADATAEDGTQE